MGTKLSSFLIVEDTSAWLPIWFDLLQDSDICFSLILQRFFLIRASNFDPSNFLQMYRLKFPLGAHWFFFDLDLSFANVSPVSQILDIV